MFQFGETNPPGRYVTSLETPRAGAYHLELAQKVGGRVLGRQSRGLKVGYPDELRLRPTNEDLLKSIARVSGGTYDPKPETIFAPADPTANLLQVLDRKLQQLEAKLKLERLADHDREVLVLWSEASISTPCSSSTGNRSPRSFTNFADTLDSTIGRIHSHLLQPS